MTAFSPPAKHDFGSGRLSDDTMERVIIDSMMTKDPKVQKPHPPAVRAQGLFLTLRDRMIGSGCHRRQGLRHAACPQDRRRLPARFPRARRSRTTRFTSARTCSTPTSSSNNCWKTRIEQRTQAGLFFQAPKRCVSRRCSPARFPENIREQLHAPCSRITARVPSSCARSSFLEDGFGNAFAGKYESVFCVNSGPLGAAAGRVRRRRAPRLRQHDGPLRP